MRDFKFGLLIAVGAMIFISFCWGLWQGTRWFNFRFGYESQVRGVIIQTVKPECLK